jgi:hypothetical protein
MDGLAMCPCPTLVSTSLLASAFLLVFFFLFKGVESVFLSRTPRSQDPLAHGDARASAQPHPERMGDSLGIPAQAAASNAAYLGMPPAGQDPRQVGASLAATLGQLTSSLSQAAKQAQETRAARADPTAAPASPAEPPKELSAQQTHRRRRLAEIRDAKALRIQATLADAEPTHEEVPTIEVRNIVLFSGGTIGDDAEGEEQLEEAEEAEEAEAEEPASPEEAGEDEGQPDEEVEEAAQ